MRWLTTLVLIVSLLLLAPWAAGADARRFIPRLSAYELFLDVEGEHEREDNTVNGQGLSTHTTTLSEKLVFNSLGYVYHPRFITFLGSLTGGVRHSDGNDRPWENELFPEYELRAYVLPEHPYNLELFTLRREPTITGRSLVDSDPTFYQKGGIFRYKLRPVFFDLGYTVDDIESKQSDSTTKSVVTNASYFTDTFSLGGGYAHSDSETTSSRPGGRSTEYGQDRYYANNVIEYKKTARLFSDLQLNTKKERRSGGARERTRLLQWTERLDLTLSKNLDANLSYSYFDDTRKSENTVAGTQDRNFSRSHNPYFSITHRLYRSLVTQYNFNYLETKTSTGELKTTAHLGGVTYTKLLPRDSRVSSSVFLGTTLTDSTGAPLVLEEAFSVIVASPNNTYTLRQQNVNTASIVVEIQHPTTPADRQPLIRGVHYDILPLGSTVRLTIIGLGGITFADASSPNPAIAQQFFVSYAANPGDYELRTDTAAYSLQFDLFKNLFSPRFSYSRSDQKLLSGSIVGGPQSTSTTTVGFVARKEPFTLLADYMRFESDLNPLRRWKAELGYRKALTDTLFVDSRIRYERTDYLKIAGEPGSGYTEELQGVDAMVQKSFAQRALQVTLSGAYYRTVGPTDTNTYVLNNILNWRVGGLELEAGANVIHTASESRASEQTYTTQLYYLKLRRKLI